MTSNDLPAVSQGPTRSSASGRYLALRSLISKILLLLVVFIAVPVILYNEFRRADQDKQVLLSESLQEQGRLMAESLRPLLQREGGSPLLALPKEVRLRVELSKAEVKAPVIAAQKEVIRSLVKEVRIDYGEKLVTVFFNPLSKMLVGARGLTL